MTHAAPGGSPGSFDRFVALGDSTTEGLEDRYPGGGYRGWADRLAELLATVNPGIAYANLAIRGRKVPQIRAEQLEPAIRLEPDLVSILGGINDILRPSFDLDRVAGDLDAMATALGRRGATVLAFTFPDPTAAITIARRPIRARVERFNDRVRRMAATRGAVLVDLAAGGVADPAHWSADRLHANGAGHARIAAAAAAALGAAPDPEPGDPPPPRRRGAATRYAADAVWIGRHLTPWLVRRIRGVSSGDGRDPKRPELRPVLVD
ncbi:MAG: SGNH/GDSL hydrolase family protein [Acidobacteria bacterium]|nr:MAG: SGNH/GDSL hydrolase family protein [Acidobacteriota bacterium]MCL4287442.1 SGNH/GDSL hydrolase family protein [Thermoleophilia bacterium]GIK77268.1 MAG: lysophospholipase [Actinomycetes bacterium]